MSLFFEKRPITLTLNQAYKFALFCFETYQGFAGHLSNEMLKKLRVQLCAINLERIENMDTMHARYTIYCA